MLSNEVSGKAWSVLIVDDEALVRDALGAMLESRGKYRVVGTLSRGDDASEAAKSLAPDLVVLDIEMPGRSAFDSARAIRAASPGSRVIFLSAHVHRRFLQEAQDIGVSAYLSKSESGAAIMAALDRVVGGERVWPADEGGSGTNEDPSQRLTPRELEVLKYISQGLSTREMASIMFLSPRTVERHVERLMGRLGIRDRLRLALYAFSHGLAPSPAAGSLQRPSGNPSSEASLQALA
jgi:DNA-binding NarL/FixJ family response regulator